jgi:hypothetical protein
VTSGKPGASSRDDDFGTAGQGGSAEFFRGTELSRLLVLLAIAVIGWIVVWNYMVRQPEPLEEPRPAPGGIPDKVEPDTSPAFESVTDRTPIGLRDMAAYNVLLQRARETRTADLARQSRRDIYFTDLWERPEKYRGVPVHLLGTARRIMSYESKHSAKGRLYEAWVSTHESQGYPYVCVFEDLPERMPVGPDVSERVVFNGYFLKQMFYLAGKDVQRAAPVVIGKIGWTPSRSAPARDNSVFWMALIVGVMFVISLFRWVAGLRRSLSTRRRRTTRIDRPAEEIAPPDLAEWIESLKDDEGEQAHENDPENRRG